MITKIRSNSYLLAAVAALILATGVHAASIFDITYPIAELGNCADRTACKTYCDEAANREACIAFAQAHGLTVSQRSSSSSSSTPTQTTDPTVAAIEADGGPGQCAVGASDPKAACKQYCSVSTNIQECVAYGKSHHLFSSDQESKADSVVTAVQNGQLPGNCTSKDSCQSYCEQHRDECMAFAQAHGLTVAQGQGQGEGQGTLGTSTASRLQGLLDHTQGLSDCLANAVGQDAVSAALSGAAPADTVAYALSTCMQQLRPQEGMMGSSTSGKVGLLPPLGTMSSTTNGRPTSSMLNLPPAVLHCLQSSLSADSVNHLMSGNTQLSADDKTAVSACVSQYRQAGQPQGTTTEHIQTTQLHPQTSSTTNEQGNWMPPPLNSNAAGTQIHLLPPPTTGTMRFTPAMGGGGTPMPGQQTTTGSGTQQPPSQGTEPSGGSPTSFVDALSQMAAATLGILSGHF